MKFDLYTYCLDNENLMPFFLDHYIPLVDRITFIDNGSTDKTLDIIQSRAGNGCILQVIHSGMTTWDWDLGLIYRNNVWKKSDYDIIMWADPDEFIYHPNLREFIQRTNADIYQTKGYDMVYATFPKAGTNILDIKMGCRAPLEDKFVIWKRTSKVMSKTAHSIEKTNEKINVHGIGLLHYKYLGAKEMTRRANQIKARVPVNSVCVGIGNKNILKEYPAFVRTYDEYVIEIADRVSKAIKVI